MKRAPQALRDALYLYNVHRARDLYTVEMAVGTQRWTSADANVSWGGNTWTAERVFGQPSGHSELGLVVDSLRVRLGSEIVVSSKRLVERALAGELHGVRLEVRRAWLAPDGSVAGTEVLFDGRIDYVEPDSTQIEVTARCVVGQMQDSLIPGHFVQPACPYLVGSGVGCTVDMSTFTDARTVASGTTADVVVLNSASTRLVVGSTLHFTATGTRATVLEVVSSTTARIASPLAVVPSAGAAVNVVRACDQTTDTCGSVFDNLVEFGGAPSAPVFYASR